MKSISLTKAVLAICSLSAVFFFSYCQKEVSVSPAIWQFGEVTNFDAPLLAKGLEPRLNGPGAARGLNPSNVGLEKGTIFFSSDRGGPQVGFDLFVSNLEQDGLWSKATNEGALAALNSRYDDRAPSLTADGKTIFFSSTRPGGQGGMDIYMSNLENGQWTKPVNLGGRLNSPSDDEMPGCTPDGKAIYFGSTRAGGFGGMDIWLTTLQDGKWTEPVNLGPTVNSPYNDTGPTLAEEQTLFFSSYRSGGLGDKDIWYTVKVNGQWAKPINPGAPINSLELDGCPTFSSDLTTFYFASGRAGGVGLQDIYIAPMKRIRQ